MGNYLNLEFDRKLKKHEELLLPELTDVLEKLGLSLYDFDYQQGSSTFRVFIYNDDSKTASLDDCVKVDRALSDFFDSAELPENVRLEVSSPGLYRFLRKVEHFEMSIGENIKVQTIQKLEGLKSKSLEGLLKAVSKESITLDISKQNMTVDINFSNIKSANAEYIF